MLTNEEILSLVRQESNAAESYVTSEISEEREDALERYLGEDYGDEMPGRSKVIDRSVFEVIEWAMPSIMRVFSSGDDVVEYTPKGPEDEENAKQATDYANFVFYSDNPGFLILNTWFKDAFLAKMGVVKSWWEEKTTIEHESYSGLTDDELMVFEQDDEVEITALTSYGMDGIEREDNETAILGMDGLPLPSVYDIDIKRTITDGRIKVMPVPPEEFYISSRSADPDTAPYLEHRTNKTPTDLINEGFDKKIVENLPGDDNNDPNGERETRMGQTYDEEDRSDNAMREIAIHDSYVWLDKGETGVAERYNVIWAGEVILECKPTSKQPFSLISPIPIPHRAYGLSFADIVSDLQRIKTTLLRQTLDNLYLSNNPEREVDIKKIVSMDDFLMTRPGGIKRVKEIGATREISHPFVAQHSFAMLDGLDSMISNRTGIKDAVTGVDADVLANETATASNNNMAAANQRIEMVSRIFAETGVKHLFRNMLHLMVQHQDKPRTIRLRNEWVEVDPRTWNAEMDVTIEVGLGHGNKDQQVGHLMNILTWQKEMLASGGVQAEDGPPMVKPKHIYNTFEKVIKAVGFKNVDSFMDDPGDGPLPQPEQGQDPNAALIQGQMQIEQMKLQGKQMELQAKMSADDVKAQREHELAVAKLRLEQEKLEIDREKIRADMQQTAAKIESDKDQAAAKLYADVERDRLNAQEADKDRVLNISENQRNREAKAASPQRQVKVERDEDGNLVGTMDAAE
ncbi:MAG: hypothetical protein KAS66_05235 [Candidatus Omnitrophica bacterium]|nr:hypothetical protein [Candidatus Omnitrophota bacterium]